MVYRHVELTQGSVDVGEEPFPVLRVGPALILGAEEHPDVHVQGHAGNPTTVISSAIVDGKRVILRFVVR